MIRSCWYPTSNDDNSSCASVKSWVSQLPLLTLIFQKSLDEGNIPNDWRTANFTAIFKKGERYKASRGFSFWRSFWTPSMLTVISGIGYQHDLIILDFSKAFDRVPHERLLKKLDHYGIRDSTQGWIRAFLSNRTQQVVHVLVLRAGFHNCVLLWIRVGNQSKFGEHLGV
jgi:hypothetical protein